MALSHSPADKLWLDCELGAAIMNPTNETGKTPIPLDWKRLLGFDQAAATSDGAAAFKLSDPRLAKLGAKSGVKLSGRRPKF